MALFFEWDEGKSKLNLIKHGIAFEEASTVFKDISSITIDDPLHSTDENRFIIMGYSYSNRLLVVVHTERRDYIRIISARLATKRERKVYEEKE